MQADWESDWVSLKYLLCCTFGFLSKPAGVLWDSWPVQKWSIFPNPLDICHKPCPGKCHSIILAQNISIILLLPEMCVSAVRTQCHHPCLSLKCCYDININCLTVTYYESVRMFFFWLGGIWFVYLFENWYVCLSNAHSSIWLVFCVWCLITSVRHYRYWLGSTGRNASWSTNTKYSLNTSYRFHELMYFQEENLVWHNDIHEVFDW